jgi:hypothetical protein
VSALFPSERPSDSTAQVRVRNPEAREAGSPRQSQDPSDSVGFASESPQPSPDRSTLVLARIWKRVTKTPTCWLWDGALSSYGYGLIKAIPGKSPLRVHRLTYEAEKGPIPDGLELDHLCSTRRCCRPSHLEAVTHAENMRRAHRSKKRAKRLAKTATATLLGGAR